MKSYADGQAYGSPGWDPKFIQRLLDEDKRMRDKGTPPRDVIDMNKIWPKVQKLPEKQKNELIKSMMIANANQITPVKLIRKVPKHVYNLDPKRYEEDYRTIMGIRPKS